MEIKHYDKPGYIAWSNSKNYSELLASASFTDNQGFYSLDILEIDLQERSKKINLVGTGYTDTPFRCIAWDNFGEKESTYSNGLIFTGMEDGSFLLWNPQNIISSYPPPPPTTEGLETQQCIIYKEEAEEEQFPVMCAQWNNLKNNFLAFGGTEVLLLNVGKDPCDPEVSKPGKKNPHAKSYVTSVSWNREVPHILASSSQNGLVALWDIKTNNSIFQFKDSGASSGDRNVVICWSKSISTQIAVTLDDEKRNELQIWDLRNQKGPVVVIDKVHTKGINSMDWCETDPELILTASRDNRISCWNYTQEEAPLSESTIDGGIFTLKWSKKLPSIYAVSNEEKISVCSLNDNLFGYVPKWYKVPVGATLLGSQASLTFSEQRGSVLHEAKLPSHSKNNDLRADLKALNNALEGVFDEKQNQSQISSLIKAKTSSEADCGIYDYLGLNKEKIVKEVEKYTGKKREFAIGQHKNTKEKNVKPKAKAYTQIQGQDALAFFAEIGNKTVQPSPQQEDEDNEGDIQYGMVPRNFNWDKGKERIVKQNILIGNYQGAIDAALKCGRTAEALIIAYSVDQNQFSTTLKTFFTETTDNFITDVLKCIAYRDPVELINKYDLVQWKECIASIYSMTSSDKRSHLLSLLAERLLREVQNQDLNKEQIIPQNYAPIICYILAEQFHKIASIYSSSLSHFKPGSLSRKRAVIEYARRLVIIEEASTIEHEVCREYSQILRESMFVAIEEGQNVIAKSICDKLPNSNNKNKILDYMANTTTELQKFKSSVSYKIIPLPMMQPKKQEKKVQNKVEHVQKGPKRNIFPKEEEKLPIAPPPPPGPKKNRDEDSGFSPYENTNTNKQPQLVERPPPPVKKNLNTPPPPPVKERKAPNTQLVEEDQEIERQPIHRAPLQPTPHKKMQPPPPPPPIHHTPTHQAEEDQREVMKKAPPPKREPPPPQRKNLPPPPIQEAQRIAPKYEEEAEEQYQLPPQPPKKKITPPPQSHNRMAPEPDQIPTKQEPTYPPPPAPKKGPPPARKEVYNQPPQLPPPPSPKVEQTYQQPVRKQMPLPTSGVKRGPPPPPPRR